MAEAPALKALVATASDEPILHSLTTGALEAVGPAGLLQSSLSCLLGSVELHELGRGQARLKLEPIHSHGDNGLYFFSILGYEGPLTELAT